MQTKKFEDEFSVSGDMTGDAIYQQCRERIKVLRTIAARWIVRELIEKRGGVNCWMEQTVTEDGGNVQLTVEVHYTDPHRRVPDPYQPSQFFMLPKGKVDFTFQAKDDPAVRERLEKLKSLFSPVDTRTMETTDDEPCDDWGAPLEEQYGEPRLKKVHDAVNEMKGTLAWSQLPQPGEPYCSLKQEADIDSLPLTQLEKWQPPDQNEPESEGSWRDRPPLL